MQLGFYVLMFIVQSWGALPPDASEYLKFVTMKEKASGHELHAFAQQFIAKHPQSPHTDNMIHTLAKKSVEDGDYKKGLRYWGYLLKNFKDSDKAKQAMYGQAFAWKKLGEFKKAQQSFQRIKKKYPGSQEAMRAELELKGME